MMTRDGEIEMHDTGFAVALTDTNGRHCYLTTGDGDPPRTYNPKFANRYKTSPAASAAITRAMKRTPFRKRKMIVVPFPTSSKPEPNTP